MTKDKNAVEVDAVMRGFVGILARNGQLKFKNAIAEKFEKIYNEKNRVVKSEIISKSEISESLEAGIKDMLKDKYGDREIIIKKKADTGIKGGIVIRSGDEMLDGSMARQFEKLKKRLEGK